MSHFHDPFRPTSLRSDDAPKAAVAAPVDESDKVPSGTAKEILAWVDGDKERAQKALDAEQSHDNPRKGLVKDLGELLEEDDDDE